MKKLAFVLFVISILLACEKENPYPSKPYPTLFHLEVSSKDGLDLLDTTKIIRIIQVR